MMRFNMLPTRSRLLLSPTLHQWDRDSALRQDSEMTGLLWWLHTVKSPPKTHTTGLPLRWYGPHEPEG